MARCLNVHLLPELVRPEELRGGVAVVIDVLRASTTIVTALAAGADGIIPCEHVDQAREIAAGLPPETTLLGGERGGQRIDGFDLGNSPAEYTPAVCRAKTIVFTTTNGTRALQHASQADRILIGAFVNCRALGRVLVQSEKPVHLLCAGIEGEIAKEDALAAGAIVQYFVSYGIGTAKLNDQAGLVWDAYGHRIEELPEALRTCRGARNLHKLGFDSDIDAAAQIDEIDLVPIFQHDSRRITPMTLY